MRTSFSRSFVVLASLGTGVLLVGCGGDDSGSGSGGSGGGDAVSIEEFCDKISALESAVEPDDMASAVAVIADLADSAPTDELKDALETMLPVLEGMAEIDENDPDAMNELMTLMMDPDVMEASAVMEAFGDEECGFTPSS